MSDLKAEDVIDRIMQYSNVFNMAACPELLIEYPMMISPFEMFLLARKLSDSFLTVPANINAMVFYGVSLKVVE